MTLALAAQSTPVEAAGGSPNVNYPSGISAGHLLVATVLGDNDTGTVSTPSGWTLITSFASTVGSVGGGTGPRKLTMFYKVATGSESGTQSFSTSGFSAASGFMWRITSTVGSSYDIASTSGEDTTTGGTWSAVMSSDPGFVAGDLLLSVLAGPTTASNFVTSWGTESIAPPGCTATFTGSTAEWEFSIGNDAAFRGRAATIDTGVSSGSITHTASAVPATNTQVLGPEIIVRVREVLGPNDIVHGAESRSSTTFSTGDFNWTHAAGADPAGAVVIIVQEGSTDSVAGVTYDGVAMDFVRSDVRTTSEAGRVYIYHLGSGLPSGDATVAVDTTATHDRVAYCSTVRSGGGASEVDVSNGADVGVSSNPSLTLNYTDSLVSWVGFYGIFSGLAAPVTTVQAGSDHQFGNDLGSASAMAARKSGADE